MSRGAERLLLRALAGSLAWVLTAIETAVRRQDAALADGPVLNEELRVDLATLLAAYTREAAWVMHQDGRTGVLAPGYRADLVVLDRDLFALPAERISEACVDLTVIDGKVVYRARRDESDDCKR